LANGLVTSEIVYENKFVTCILDHIPLNEGHVLVLPKGHYSDLDQLDDIVAAEIIRSSILMSKAIKSLYKPDGVTVIQNSGVFNDLGHYHMHVFPRYKLDGFGWIEPEHSGKAKNKLNENGLALIEMLETI